MLFAVADSARNLSLYIHLPILLVIISLVYSATRFEHWGPILREAMRWGARMAVFLLGIAAALYLAALLV
jgi:hypothetical protein